MRVSLDPGSLEECSTPWAPTDLWENEAVHRYIRQLMAIPFLPAVQTTEALENLKQHARLPQLISLVNYIERQWFRNPVFRVDDWSVFQQTGRTNNDVEGM